MQFRSSVYNAIESLPDAVWPRAIVFNWNTFPYITHPQYMTLAHGTSTSEKYRTFEGCRTMDTQASAVLICVERHRDEGNDTCELVWLWLPGLNHGLAENLLKIWWPMPWSSSFISVTWASQPTYKRTQMLLNTVSARFPSQTAQIFVCGHYYIVLIFIYRSYFAFRRLQKTDLRNGGIHLPLGTIKVGESSEVTSSFLSGTPNPF